MFGVNVVDRGVNTAKGFVGGYAHEFGATGGIECNVVFGCLAEYVEDCVTDVIGVPGVVNVVLRYADTARFKKVCKGVGAVLHVRAYQHDDVLWLNHVIEHGGDVGYGLGRYEDEVGGDGHV